MRKNKKRFVPWKMQAITTAHSVGAQLCESLTNCSSPAGRWWGWPNEPSQGSRVELRKTLLFFFVKLARVKMVIDVELFYGTCVSEIYCFDVLLLPVRHRRYTQLGLWGLSVEALAGEVSGLDGHGRHTKGRSGRVDISGRGKAGSSRTPWEAT